MGDQECSYRLGFDKKSEEKLTEICCVEVYNIAWVAVKEMVKKWNYIHRPPHYDELYSAWYDTPLNEPFKNIHLWKDIVNKAKKEIIRFYQINLNRKPNRNELMGAFRQCFINPNFKYDWKIKSRKKDGTYTKRYMLLNYKNRDRIDEVTLCDLVEVGQCVICGKPVFTYNNSLMLKHAGYIKMEFGYGSHRDNDSGKGYIHDLCSAKLDQQMLKNRLDWGKHDNKQEIDIKNSNDGDLKFITKKTDIYGHPKF